MLAKRISQIYLWIMLAIFPLVIHDYLFDILTTKYNFFMIISILYIGAMMIFDVYTHQSFEMNLLDRVVLFFMGVMLVSTLCSLDRGLSWTGESGRLQGLLTYLLYGGLYFALSRHAQIEKSIWIAGFIGVASTTLIACFNYYKIDPLGIYTKMDPSSYYAFISTIGNINFYSAYLCLMIPFFTFRFATSSKASWLEGVGGLVSMLGLACANTDSGLIALVIYVVIGIGFLKHNLVNLKRFLIMLGFGMILMSIFVNMSYFFAHYMETSTLFLIVFHPLSVLVWLLIMFGIYWLLGHTHLNTLYWRYLAYLGLGILLLFIILNTLLKNWNLGILEHYLHFNESWASYRGMTWIYTWKTFCQSDLKVWLVGTGPETFALLTDQAALFGDLVLDAAHNVYLQLLVTTGILGFSSYLTMFVCILKENLQKQQQLAICLAILCYLVQDFSNIAQPSSTPLLFVMFGLLASRSNYFLY